jgi:glycyl-tRNA synthetase
MAAAAATRSLPATLTSVVKAEFEDTCLRRFFFGPSNDPYPGTAGLFDMGPVMTAMKVNFLDIWRRHFVVAEGLCELDLPAVTPEAVFIASGHVERFTDVMVRDTVSGECFRLDKYIEEWCEARLADKKTKEDDKAMLKRLCQDAGSMDIDKLETTMNTHGIKSSKGNALSKPFAFNLMFKNSIGPEGTKIGYLRPELAQGIILNFKRLVDTGHAPRMPFGAACVGNAYRNEIAPRAALIRVREFTLAEIEWFVNPNEKKHPKFDSVRNLTIWAWDKDQQREGRDPTERTIGELVDGHLIDNETLAYFVARTALFLQRVGVKTFRFRQHRCDSEARELAHYAQDCWDAECLTTYGWIECVGVADRSAYDLEHHIAASKKDLTARVDYAEPKKVRKFVSALNKKACTAALGTNMGDFIQYTNDLKQEDAVAFDANLTKGAVELTNKSTGTKYNVTRDLITFEWKDVKETGFNYVPSVIEPSFGVGRILYAVLEQSYWVRRDETGKNDKRAVFSFLTAMAAQKVAVLPLMVKPAAMDKVRRLMDEFAELGIPARSDDSGGAIGKKYARVDELGIPYAITCDFEEDGKVTLRERDSAEQVRVPIDEAGRVVYDLCRTVNPVPWSKIRDTYPAQAATKE